MFQLLLMAPVHLLIYVIVFVRICICQQHFCVSGKCLPFKVLLCHLWECVQRPFCSSGFLQQGSEVARAFSLRSTTAPKRGALF